MQSTAGWLTRGIGSSQLDARFAGSVSRRQQALEIVQGYKISWVDRHPGHPQVESEELMGMSETREFEGGAGRLVG